MRDSMLSIVEHDNEPKLMNVYARVRGDIERVFPEADVIESIEGDYRFRTSLPRDRVTHAIALKVNKIDYPVFGDALAADRHKPYLDVWSTMYDEQERLYGPVSLDLDETPKPIPKYVLEDERYSLDLTEEEEVEVETT